MNDEILTLKARSPEDLEAKLRSLAQGKPWKGRYAALAIHDARIITRSFRLLAVPFSEVEKRVHLLAVEALSLPAQDLVFDYQIFQQDREGICGVFSCLARPLFDEYAGILDSAGLIPCKITVQMLAGLDAFFLTKEPFAQNFCFLDFSPAKIVNLSIYKNKKVSLLRQIPFESVPDVRHDVLQSLRSVSGQENDKKIEHIYVSGDLNAADKKMIEEIAETFGAKAEQGVSVDSRTSLAASTNFITINLSRHLTLSMSTRRKIMMLFRVIWFVLLVCSLLLAGLIARNIFVLKEQRSSYAPSQYQEAQELEKKLKGAGYAQQ